MPNEASSKIDYHARYKRRGDIIIDTVEGKIIPLRKCPQQIKKGLGVK